MPEELCKAALPAAPHFHFFHHSVSPITQAAGAMAVTDDKTALLANEKRPLDDDEAPLHPSSLGPSTGLLRLVLLFGLALCSADILSRHASPCWTRPVVLPSHAERKATETLFLTIPSPQSIIEASRKCAPAIATVLPES